MEFVIHINGEAPEKGFWVLAVDPFGKQFLIAGKEGKFRWVAMDNCTFVRGANPEVPRPVVMVQPRQGLAVPQLRVGNGKQ